MAKKTGKQKTKEQQYGIVFDVAKKHGVSKLGLMANVSWNQDPKRTLFTLSRYKFVAKMLAGKKKVLEVGCADAFGTRLVQQEVGSVTAVDFDPVFIADAKARMDPAWPVKYQIHDMLSGPVTGSYDGIYSLDVLEHISPANEDVFMVNMLNSLQPNGTLVIGTPSLESQVHASTQSKAGHINCKSGRAFKTFLEKYFDNVFVFSMNDEVVHTGYYPMAHYLLALCTTPKNR
ncbi:MAG: class I SAM-dependent methyltransferase [Candidatus Omnitrophota bacterium]|jgi:2-polyprenyl-3-methyl-5-hydroxy-6-metoxy-1,4-benzoquinol methylase